MDVVSFAVGARTLGFACAWTDEGVRRHTGCATSGIGFWECGDDGTFPDVTAQRLEPVFYLCGTNGSRALLDRCAGAWLRLRLDGRRRPSPHGLCHFGNRPPRSEFKNRCPGLF